jgi:hypothetical protein
LGPETPGEAFSKIASPIATPPRGAPRGGLKIPNGKF